MGDIANDFWKKYIEADCIAREEMLKNLPLVKELIKLRNEPKINDELYQHILLMSFSGYIDDLIDYKYLGETENETS